MERSDGQLVQRTRGGDREAFGALVDRYRDMAYGLGYHLTGEFEAARDLAQEAFVQAYVRLGQLREPEKFAGWLRRIVVNVHRMQQRRREVTTVALDDQAAAPQRPPSEIEVVVRDALSKLREPERLALTLHYINGYSHAEIGGFLGVRPETVKTRLARARQRLREEMIHMAEDLFEEKALPPEFRQDVVASVERLVNGLRSALPDNLREIRERVRVKRNRLWRDTLSRLPAPWCEPLLEQGEAPQIAVADLPSDLRHEVREAMCYTWFDWVLSRVDGTLPWVLDLDVLWIRFYERDGKPCVWLADVPGTSGTIYRIGGLDVSPPTAEDSDTVEALPPVPSEFTEMFENLRQAVPGRSGSVRQALESEMRQRLAEARERLPASAKATMQAGQRVQARELPESLRRSISEAVSLHWAVCVLEAVEQPPTWLTQFDDSRIEFGLYPRDIPLESAGTPYVKVYGPDGDASSFQIGIGQSFDNPIEERAAKAAAPRRAAHRDR